MIIKLAIWHTHLACLLSNAEHVCNAPRYAIVTIKLAMWHTQSACLLSMSVTHRYAIVTRPVRQSRLKLALEEVLSSQGTDTAPSQTAPQESPQPQTPYLAERDSAASVSQQIHDVGQQSCGQSTSDDSSQEGQHSSQQPWSEISQQPAGRQSDPLAAQLNGQSDLHIALSTQSMPSVPSGTSDGVHAVPGSCQQRRNSYTLQRAPKVCRQII